MKKSLLVLIVLILCSGCNIKYNANFSDSMREEVIVFDNSHIDDKFNLEEGFMDGMSAFEFFFQTLPYRANSDGKGNYSANKSFNDINDFIDNSFVFNKLISSDSIKVKGSNVNINITSKNLKDNFDIDSLEVSLYIPYYVSKHNADKVSDNTYTWIIKDINKDSIKVKFDMSKAANFRYKIFAVIAIALIIGAAAWVVMYFIKRNKEANEI